MPVPWFTGGSGIEQIVPVHIHTQEVTMDAETAAQVKLTVFGNRFQESCNPGG